MVNRDRIINEFMELVRIDSLTRKERQMADILKEKLKDMNLSVYEDNAGEKIGGNCGNLICNFKGDENLEPILLMAHMDTVIPGIGKKPVIDGEYIKSDGTTILGGDDLAGVECILEAIRIIKENDIPHGDIQIVFSVAEEGGLFGAKNLDYEKIYAKYGFVFDDGGIIGSVSTIAPAQNKIDVVIHGKAAHAGIEPERGISAIQIAAEAISNMRLGRIDEETTCNIGTISGGQVTNIICDKVEIKAECRSRDMDKLENHTKHMTDCFIKAAETFGGKVDLEVDLVYPSFKIENDDYIIDILKNASKKADIELILKTTGGGSDTNILNSRGIKSVVVSIGMDKVHSVKERIAISDLIKVTEFIVGIIKSVPNAK